MKKKEDKQLDWEGIQTPKQDIELIKRRLKAAGADYAENYERG